MTEPTPPAGPPSPLSFIGAVLQGMFIGVLPGFLVMFVVTLSWGGALIMLGFILVGSAIQFLFQELVIVWPFRGLRAIWRRFRPREDRPEPPPPPPPSTPRHPILTIGFICGVVLMTLIMFYWSLDYARGAA